MSGNLNPSIGRGIKRLFWLCLIGFIAFTIPSFGNERPATQLTGALIAALTVYPSYLWCMGKIGGVPIFPAITFACLPTYALPMIHLHKSVITYDDTVTTTAGLTVCGFLVLSIAAWLIMLRERKIPSVQKKIYVLDESGGKSRLFTMMVASIVIEILLMSGWLYIDFGTYSLLRTASSAMSILSVMCLSYEIGAGALNKSEVLLFYTLLGILMMAITVSLYLSAVFMLTMSGAVAYVTASKRLPVAWILSVCLMAFSLHPGKDAMRAHYWTRQIAVPPQDYPEFYSRWIDESLKRGFGKNDETGFANSSSERAGIIHMLMLVQKQSPENKPFLLGETLVHIPTMLLPRILITDKPEVHLGQKIMCEYYGLQTHQQTATTAIAFGPLAEAFANFGYLGVAGWAVVLGASCGWLTHTCFLTNRLTARVLLAFVITGILINGEKNFAVIVSTIVQSGMFLSVLCMFIMKQGLVLPRKSLVADGMSVSTVHP